MSQRGIDFARDWVFENVNLGPYDPGEVVINNAVDELTEAATSEGISLEEIEEDTGDIYDFVAQAFKDVTDSEVSRLAEKDD